MKKWWRDNQDYFPFYILTWGILIFSVVAVIWGK